jgi:1-deoxy-D-xylulose-5-phosphate synthase
MPFNLATGETLEFPGMNAESYDDIFARHMLELMQRDERVAVITAGTPGVLAFGPERRAQAGRQFIDVGIAEQDAVAVASGMAKAGARPCFGVVSSFIQRAYDQLSQDVAINNTPVVLNLFYATIVGMTDVTHLGWFDIPLISNIPGWVFLAPTSKEEYLAMLDWAMSQTAHPVAVRMPSGAVVSDGRDYSCVDYEAELNRYEVVERGRDVAIIAAGTFFSLGKSAVELLKAKGLEATLINPRFLSGVDSALLDELQADHSLVITLEDGALDGGFGEKIARYYGPTAMRVRCYGLLKEFRDRYNYAELLRENHLAPELIVADIVEAKK